MQPRNIINLKTSENNLFRDRLNDQRLELLTIVFNQPQICVNLFPFGQIADFGQDLRRNVNQ